MSIYEGNPEYLRHIKTCMECKFSLSKTMPGNWCEICGRRITTDNLYVVSCDKSDFIGFVACLKCVRNRNKNIYADELRASMDKFKKRIGL